MFPLAKAKRTMLRRRSGAVGNKQGLMSDYSTLPSPTTKNDIPSSCLLPLSRPFVGSLAGKGFSDPEAVMSPTSILEAKHFSAFGISFFDKNPKKGFIDTTAHPPSENRHRHWENGELKGVGLGILDTFNDEGNQKLLKSESRKVLFGSQLKIQIPSIVPTSMSRTNSLESTHSPIEFGIKTRNSLLGSLSPNWRSPVGSGNFGEGSSPQILTSSLSLSEMEMSEDYTCVITHGPNPRTTHIFDNYIVASSGEGFSISTKDSALLPYQSGYPSEGFLSFCHSCKKDLGQGKETFMYRGEKAFCSQECRYQEMLFEEGLVDSSDPMDDH